jgi:hypothetical protein
VTEEEELSVLDEKTTNCNFYI